MPKILVQDKEYVVYAGNTCNGDSMCQHLDVVDSEKLIHKCSILNVNLKSANITPDFIEVYKHSKCQEHVLCYRNLALTKKLSKIYRVKEKYEKELNDVRNTLRKDFGAWFCGDQIKEVCHSCTS